MNIKKIITFLVITLIITFLLLSIKFISKFKSVEESHLFGIIELPNNSFYMGTGGDRIDSFTTFCSEETINNMGTKYLNKTFKTIDGKFIVIYKYYFSQKVYGILNKFYIIYNEYTLEEFINSPEYDPNILT